MPGSVIGTSRLLDFLDLFRCKTEGHVEVRSLLTVLRGCEFSHHVITPSVQDEHLTAGKKWPSRHFYNRAASLPLPPHSIAQPSKGRRWDQSITFQASSDLAKTKRRVIGASPYVCHPPLAATMAERGSQRRQLGQARFLQADFVPDGVLITPDESSVPIVLIIPTHPRPHRRQRPGPAYPTARHKAWCSPSGS